MTQTADQERVEFEAAYAKIRKTEFVSLTERDIKHWILRRDESGNYTDPNSRIAYALWQAASDRLVLGSEPVALLWQHAITGEQFVNLKNQNVPAEPNLFLVGLLCLCTVASVPTESTPDPRGAADADKAWSLHP